MINCFRFQFRTLAKQGSFVWSSFKPGLKQAYSTMGDSIFTKIIKREIPAAILHEDDTCIAIKDINPQAPHHFLVVPKEPLRGIGDATEEHATMLGHLMVTANKVAKDQKLNNGYRLVINDGKVGGQEVPHLHIHILAGRQMKWPPG